MGNPTVSLFHAAAATLLLMFGGACDNDTSSAGPEAFEEAWLVELQETGVFLGEVTGKESLTMDLSSTQSSCSCSGTFIYPVSILESRVDLLEAGTTIDLASRDPDLELGAYVFAALRTENELEFQQPGGVLTTDVLYVDSVRADQKGDPGVSLWETISGKDIEPRSDLRSVPMADLIDGFQGDDGCTCG